MLDLNAILREFAVYMLEHAATSYSLDAALINAVERAYQQGMTDAMLVPAVLIDPIPDLDTGIPAGMRGANAFVHVVVESPRVPGASLGGGAGGQPEGGNDATASRYGCHSLNPESTYARERCGHDLRGTDIACSGCKWRGGE